jgi:uncharacterized cupredoxin-like copper-binding protein
MHPNRRRLAPMHPVVGTRHRRLVLWVAVMPLLLGACSQTAPTLTSPSATSTAGGLPSGASMDVSLTEFAITPDALTAAAGEVTFTIKNDGTMEHEFVIIRTDLAADALPTDGSTVDEEGLDVIDEAEGIAPGDTATLTVRLEPGAYVVICNLPGHYAGGMRASLLVSG